MLEPGNGAGNGGGNGGGVGRLEVDIFACGGMGVLRGADPGLGVGETCARGFTVILGLTMPSVGIGVAGVTRNVGFGSALGCSGLDVVCCGCG